MGDLQASDTSTRVTVDVHPDVVLDELALRDAIAAAASRPAATLGAFSIERRTIDARHGKVRLHLEVAIHGQAAPAAPPPAIAALADLRDAPTVAVVGAGPAGMFCAWALARAGIRAVVFDRGRRVRERRRDLASLSARGELVEDSNYCFGEGGAGTFSDGKLYTRSTKRGPVRLVLETFVAHGAPDEILVDARPHIGTNRLPKVITSMREHLEAHGVAFHFDRRVTELLVSGGRVRGLRFADGDTIDVPWAVIASGHSAEDVLRMLDAKGVALEPKPFAVGVRIEHPQPMVDRWQYGALAGHPALGAAYYRLVHQPAGGGVFSFCMCPGGTIVPTATVHGHQVVNGMSPAHRRGRFANSGFVTEISLERLAALGYDPRDPFAGIALQSALERRAFEAGGGGHVAPAQRLDDFVARRASRTLPPSSYHRGLRATSLDGVLGPLADGLRATLQHFERRMPGLAGAEGIAVGVETRTSSPVRVVREQTSLQSPTLAGLVPVGEGAGFAGGIVSAALDGLRAAQAIARAMGRDLPDVA
jgi:uncharacterized FAD-dependent dehydrogenase